MKIIDLMPFEPSLSCIVLGYVLLFSIYTEWCRIGASGIKLCREDHTGIADNTFVVTAYITGRHVVCQTC